jgi:hypothetical protein
MIKKCLLILCLCVALTSIVNAMSFDNNNIGKALRSPEKATRLSIRGDDAIKHLPSQLGTLINLVELKISCFENLEDLPIEIGNLKKLEKLIIDNGNGCQMNVTIPESIGGLTSLKVLRLYGALDSSRKQYEKPGSLFSQVKSLPGTLEKLQNLEELDLGRNGIKAVPSQIASLHKLKKLTLDYNDIHELPAFIGNLNNLQELSIFANRGVTLPQSLSNLNGLKIFMGVNKLTLKDQENLRSRFPKVIFSFENGEYDDADNNEEL